MDRSLRVTLCDVSSDLCSPSPEAHCPACQQRSSSRRVSQWTQSSWDAQKSSPQTENFKKWILKWLEMCVICCTVPGCRCSSPSASWPAWTKLCGRRCKWSELDQRALMSWDVINDLGLRCEFHQFAKNRSSSLSPLTRSNNPNTNASSWLRS